MFWTRYFLLLSWQYLMKITCWKDNCLCFKIKRRIHPDDYKTKVPKICIEKEPMPNGNKRITEEDFEKSSDDSDTGEKLTWQIMALVFDKFFFILFMLMISITSLFLFSTLLGEYLSAWSFWKCFWFSKEKTTLHFCQIENNILLRVIYRTEYCFHEESKAPNNWLC